VDLITGANLTTYAAYQVTVRNTGNSTANKVVYQGRAQALTDPIQGGDPDPVTSSSVPAIQATDPTCKKTSTVFTCTLGQIAGGGSRTFVLIFQAPEAFAGITPNKRIKLVSELSFCSNTTCGNTNNASVGVAPQYTTLITTDDAAIASSLKSVVPSSGASLFTGGLAAATPGDPWKTTVVVPSLVASDPPQSYLITSIEESTTLDTRVSCTSVQCWDTNLLIPNLHFPKDSGAKLTITLLKDASIVGGGNIKNATVWYINSANEIKALDACADTGGPSPGIPCVASRKEYPKTGTAKNPVPPGFEGDWEFVIEALDNGRYEI
jgi:hypothetical protein